jgi:hypothetical protein
MVCLRNISVDTLHKRDTDNNNNNNNNNNNVRNLRQSSVEKQNVRITALWEVTILLPGKHLPMFRKTTASRCSVVKIDDAGSIESSKNVYYTTEHRSSHSLPAESQILKIARRYCESINEDFSSLTTRTCGSQPWPQF